MIQRTPGIVAAARASGIAYALSLVGHTASVSCSHVGDVACAREYLAEAEAAAPALDHGHLSVDTAVARASLLLAEGDEAGAGAALHDAALICGLDIGSPRRWWRKTIPLSYVLVPEIRAHWQGAKLRGHLAVCRDLGAAVVAARSHDPETVLRSLQLPDLTVVRAALHHRHAAELAVGLTAAGRQEGRRLLDLLGPAGREAVREMSTGGGAEDGSAARSRQAKALLAAVPAPPPHVTRLGVLGPVELRRGQADIDPVDAPDLRRQRVHELLAYLVGHRRTTRGAVTAALWPDLDERSAGNNLKYTLNRLNGVLEPWRRNGEATFFIRGDSAGLQLVTGEHLKIDVDLFDEHIARAADAEADGAPSLALKHILAAVELYRDQLHVDLPDAEWLALDREHYRTRFVRAAVRAGQLLLGRGDIDQSHTVAQRLLAIDLWSEDAHQILVFGALARGDRSAAHRLLHHCLGALAELGATPSPATEQLCRRLRSTAQSWRSPEGDQDLSWRRPCRRWRGSVVGAGGPQDRLRDRTRWAGHDHRAGDLPPLVDGGGPAAVGVGCHHGVEVDRPAAPVPQDGVPFTGRREREADDLSPVVERPCLGRRALGRAEVDVASPVKSRIGR